MLFLFCWLVYFGYLVSQALTSLRGEAKPRRGNLIKQYYIPEIATPLSVARNDGNRDDIRLYYFLRTTYFSHAL